ncbi:MAG: hypothetical protein ACI4GB_06010 [Acutalibacteraceae bacterium]
MNSDTLKLLEKCDAGTKTAVNSIKSVLDDIDNTELLTMLNRSLEEHEAIGNEIGDLLSAQGEKGADPGPAARLMSWMKINFKLMEKPGNKTVANLIYDGCSMGVKQLSEYLNEYREADEKSRRLAERLIREEQQLLDNLKNYL